MLNALAYLASARSVKLADALLTFSPVFTLLISALFVDKTPEPRGLLGVAPVSTVAEKTSRVTVGNYGPGSVMD
jgi:drug/metabolite transporter (DMT)-like permease